MPLPNVTGLTEPPSFGNLASFGANANAFVGSLPAFRASVNALVAAMNEIGLGDLDPTGFTTGLLKAEDAAAAQALLDLVKQSGADDARAGRLMTVGAFGLGGDARSVTIAQLDAAAASGFYYPRENLSGVVDVGSPILHIQSSSNTAIQLSFRVLFNSVSFRRKAQGTWSSWVRLDPERGSNANGTYVRYSDGTQICQGNFSLTNVGLTTPYAGGFRSGEAPSVTFPAAFAVPPVVSVSCSSVANSSALYAGQTFESQNLFNPRIWAAAQTAAASFVGSYTAIGRWF